MINKLLIYMLISLVCTIIIECVAAKILKVKDKNDFINIILVNIMTNPIVTSFSFAINVFMGLFYKKIFMIFIEIVVFIVEGFIYTKTLNYKKINGYKLSMILNLSSYLIGFLIIYLEGVLL